LVASRAPTHRLVVYYLALSIGPTGSRTRVNTLLIDAGLVAGTLWVDDTLRSTVGWNPNIVGKT